MDITIVICTWNRAKLLRKTLQQITQIRKPVDSTWEVLVVNNNCTDHTAEVVKAFSQTLPIRMVVETEQGLSAARNRGVQESNAELILWTDDDVLVDNEWLIEYANAIKEHPDVTFFGGPIYPWFDGNPPTWLKDGWRVVETAYAVRDLSSESFQLTKESLPFGANYAVRQSVQKHYRYDPHLGRKGKNLMSGEETNVMLGMLDAGYKGLWLPKAQVKHFIEENRQTTIYLRRYYYSSGRTKYAVSDSVNSKLSLNLIGTPLWLLRIAIKSELRYRFRRITGNSAWLNDLRISSSAWGRISEHFRLCKNKKI